MIDKNIKKIPLLRFKGFVGEWEDKRVKDLGSVRSGTTPLRSQSEYFINGSIPWVKTTDLNNSLVYTTEEKVTTLALKETSLKLFPKGSILVAMYGGFNQIGRTGLLAIEATTNQALSVINTNRYVMPEYLLIWFNAKVSIWKKYASSSRKDPNITSSDVSNFPVFLPTIPEQQKIAAFLSAVDKKIALLTRKKALLEQYKKGVMQKLFSQEIRFKDEDGNDFPDWEEKRLGEVTEKFSIRNNSLLDEPIYSVTNQNGFVLQSDHFDREIAGEDLKAYKIIRKNQFAYNPARINVGSIAYFENKVGIISSLYVCFRSTNELDDKFLWYTLQLSKTKHYINVFGEGGVRIYLWYPLFASIKIDLPSINEQTKIASFLNKIDNKINGVNLQIYKIQEFKKGLFQQMFV